MAELITFGYRARPTPLHAMDPRIKLAAMVSLSIGTLFASPLGMLFGSGIVAAAAFPLRRQLAIYAVRLKFFLLVLLGVLVARALTTPGPVLVGWHSLTLTVPGLIMGAMICWRLGLMVVMGVLLTTTTQVTHLRAAIHWFLKYIPLIPSRTVSDMIGLLIIFIPAILMRSQLISDAQKSRGIEGRKNPLFRMRVFGMALLRHSFLSADQLSLAMTARCYNPYRTAAPWPFKLADAVSLVGLLFVWGGVIFI